MSRRNTITGYTVRKSEKRSCNSKTLARRNRAHALAHTQQLHTRGSEKSARKLQQTTTTTPKWIINTELVDIDILTQWPWLTFPTMCFIFNKKKKQKRESQIVYFLYVYVYVSVFYFSPYFTLFSLFHFVTIRRKRIFARYIYLNG